MELFKIFGKVAFDISNAERNIDKIAKESEKIGAGFKESQITTGKSLKEIAAQNGTTVNELRAKAMSLASEYKKQGMSASEATKKAYSDIGYEAKQTHETINSEIDETSSKAESSESRITKALKKIGAAVVTYFAVDKIKDFGMACIEVGSAFDAQMSTVSAISGATGEELDALRAKAKELGAQTSFSATESAQAMEYMAMAGWKTEDMMNGLEGVMNLAAASGEDLATTSDIVTDAMTAFGMSADQSGYFSDVLAQTATNANTNVSMMGETFKYVAPLAGAMGYSIEDMSAAIGLMANAGIKGSQSGTSLRGIITNLASPTDTVASAMEDLGISLTDSDGKTKSFGETLSDLRASFAELDEVQKTQYASSIAGKEGMSGLLALVNSSEDDFNKLTKSIKNCDGAAKEMSEVRLDNLQGDVTLFKSALEGAQIAISDKLTPHLRKFVQDATALIPKALDAFMKVGKYLVNTFSPAFSSLKGLFKSVSSALKPVVKRFLGMSDAEGESAESSLNLKKAIEFVADIIKTTSDVLSDFIGWLQGGSTGAENFKSVITGLVAAFVTYKAATTGLTAAFEIGKKAVEAYHKAQKLLNSTNPLGWAVIGISAVVGVSKALESLPSPTEKIREEFAKLSEEEQAVVDKAKELKESCDSWRESRDSVLADTESEFGYYQELADELGTIVDKNGAIKEGYEERAKVITNELSDALGLEFDMTDNVITNYDELADKIQDVITLKEAQAALDADMEAYSIAQKTIEDTFGAMIDAQTELQETTSELGNKQAALNAIFDEATGTYKMTSDEFYRIYGAEATFEGVVIGLQSEIEGLTERLETKTQAVKDAEKAYSECNSTIENHKGLSAAIVSEDVDRINNALDDMYSGFITCEAGTKTSLENQVKNIQTEYDNMKKAFERGNEYITEADLKAKEEQLKQAESELDKYAEMHGEKAAESGWKFANGIKSKLSEANAAGREMSQAGYDGAISVGYTSAGEKAGSEFSSGLLGKFREAFSEIISSIGSVDLSGLTSLGKVSIPHFASGGIVDRATIAQIGEDGPEAVVPLKNNTEWIDLVANKVAKAMGKDSGGGTVVNYIFENVNMNSDSDIEEAAYKFEAMRQKAAMAMGGN